MLGLSYLAHIGPDAELIDDDEEDSEPGHPAGCCCHDKDKEIQ